MWFDRVVLVSQRCRSWASPVLLGFLLASGASVRAQRPVPDEEIRQYLRQTISWYRDVGSFIQSPAGAREALFADGLRRSSTEVVRSAFEFARAQAAIPAAATPENATPSRSRTLAQSAAARGAAGGTGPAGDRADQPAVADRP
jgi:hypothetical protein